MEKTVTRPRIPTVSPENDPFMNCLCYRQEELHAQQNIPWLLCFVFPPLSIVYKIGKYFLQFNILQNIHMKTFMYSDFKEGVCLIKYEKWQFWKSSQYNFIIPEIYENKTFWYNMSLICSFSMVYFCLFHYILENLFLFSVFWLIWLRSNTGRTQNMP